MCIEFNTFQKHSADSKLSTKTYLMSVAAVFQKLLISKIISKVKVDAVQHTGNSQCDIVYIWISKFNAIIAIIY